jgi:ribosomal protein S18 acetylase RimI-like enzyme
LLDRKKPIEEKMKNQIRSYLDSDIDDIVQLSLLAWEPIFRSFQQILGPKIYSILYPDWCKSQREGVESICKNIEKYNTLVAECDLKVIGFLSYGLKMEDETGEVVLLAVHPDYQNGGIGTELNNRALENMKAAGAKMAVVETGGDESHAPARRAYEKAGYTALPIVRYFKDL